MGMRGSYNKRVGSPSRLARAVAIGLVTLTTTLAAQAPKPFPQPNQPAPPPPGQARPAPAAPAPAAPSRAPAVRDTGPTEAVLGVRLYPSAQFITSYDAGRGQRFYLYGVSASFVELVTFYKTVLKQKGDELFEAPPTHQFEIGRFRDETMAFPPSVTIKDYTWGGSAGYPNLQGGQNQRFQTVIQIVPVPPGTPPGP
jgi:hypothetical protein